MKQLFDIALWAASDDEDGTWINTAGFLDNHMTAVSIVLIVVGLATIYFAIKLMRGYSFHEDETVIIEKDENYVEDNAVIAERRQTEIPNYSKTGEASTLFKEMRITYTANGEEYSHWISDDGGYDDTVPIKYDPESPEKFYIFSGDDNFEGIPDENGDLDGNEDEDAPESVGSKGVAVTVLIIGLLIGVLGVGFLIDSLTR